jgi:hypothetical protein
MVRENGQRAVFHLGREHSSSEQAIFHLIPYRDHETTKSPTFLVGDSVAHRSGLGDNFGDNFGAICCCIALSEKIAGQFLE